MTRFSGARKFAAKWTTSIDGTKHPSKGEADWWNGLVLLQRAGKIRALELNPRWDVHVARDCPNCRDHGDYIGHIKADAAYDDLDGVRHFDDYKGYEGDTDVSKFKRKFVAARFGVDIAIVGPEAKRAAREKAKRQLKKRALAEHVKT